MEFIGCAGHAHIRSNAYLNDSLYIILSSLLMNNHMSRACFLSLSLECCNFHSPSNEKTSHFIPPKTSRGSFNRAAGAVGT